MNDLLKLKKQLEKIQAELQTIKDNLEGKSYSQKEKLFIFYENLQKSCIKKEDFLDLMQAANDFKYEYKFNLFESLYEKLLEYYAIFENNPHATIIGGIFQKTKLVNLKEFIDSL